MIGAGEEGRRGWGKSTGEDDKGKGRGQQRMGARESRGTSDHENMSACEQAHASFCQ